VESKSCRLKRSAARSNRIHTNVLCTKTFRPIATALCNLTLTQTFDLTIGPPGPPDLGNVHTNFGLSAPFVFKFQVRASTEQLDGRARRVIWPIKMAA